MKNILLPMTEIRHYTLVLPDCVFNLNEYKSVYFMCDIQNGINICPVCVVAAGMHRDRSLLREQQRDRQVSSQ